MDESPTCSVAFRVIANRTFGPVCLLVIALTGCSQNALPKKADEATMQIKQWVPSGTPAKDAQRTMEQHGFKCLFETNGTFGTLSNIDYLYCDRANGSLVQHRWQAAVVIKEGKVSDVRVTTGLVGP